MTIPRQSSSAPIERRQACPASFSAASSGESTPPALPRYQTEAFAPAHDQHRRETSYPYNFPFHAGVGLLKLALYFQIVPIVKLLGITDVIRYLRLSMKARRDVNLVADTHGAKYILRAVCFHGYLLFGWLTIDIVIRYQTMSRIIL